MLWLGIEPDLGHWTSVYEILALNILELLKPRLVKRHKMAYDSFEHFRSQKSYDNAALEIESARDSQASLGIPRQDDTGKLWTLLSQGGQLLEVSAESVRRK